MSTSTNDSIIEKDILAVEKLQGHDDWHLWAITICITLGKTWEYVAGQKTVPPAQTADSYSAWSDENLAAH